ncbi:hypothetical protein BDR05DRAFT_953025 [Suillus weaverae]|nr:hypothetical protein BDR05DRAFT_953025 [Suillus weaverae]
MTNFDLAMLTASPSPSPSPEALPLSATALVLQEESAETRIARTWHAICDQVCTLTLTVPDARGELIKEQESWMQEWSSLLMSMTACGKEGAAAKVPLNMEGKDTAALVSGRKSHRALEKLMKSWKAKAIAPAVEEPEVTTAHVAEVVLPAAGSSSKAPAEEEELITPPDMGKPASGGRKSVPVVPRSKRKAPAAPAACVTKVVKACESTIELTKHVAVSTAGDDVDESSSEAEVKVIGERVAEEKVVRSSLTIPPHTIKPLPARPAPAPLNKGKAKSADSEEVLALALAENVDLKEEVARLKEVLAQVCFHARTEQAEMIALSNKAYTNAQDWATVEMKLAELLD